MRKDIPDYLKLFIVREGKVVHGKNFSNMWLLTAMLVAVFFAIAFSNGSLNYLNDRMNDPFIKWVEIKKDPGASGSFDIFGGQLDSAAVASKYHILGHSYDFMYSFNYFGATDSLRAYLTHRFFDIRTNGELVKAIFSKDNLVEGYSAEEVQTIPDCSIGVILTAKSLERLGYESAPAYVDIFFASPGADALGFKLTNNRARVPVPVLGVVRRLPGNVDVVGCTNLYRQYFSPVFNMANENYASSLCYFVPEEVDGYEFDDRLAELLATRTDVPFYVDSETIDPRELYSFRNTVEDVEEGFHYLGFRQVVSSVDSLSLPWQACAEVDKILMAEYKDKGVYRLFPYEYVNDNLGSGDYLSIHFNDLTQIKAFADDLVEGSGLQIEMSQINAKENFQSVSVMAITLSVVIVAFAIVCILLFIVNLLRSYFQKVKRNIGTFKAFGISNKELQQVYMTIMLSLVGAALAVSLVFVSLVQLLLPLFGIVKADGFGYLSLWKCDVISFCPPLISLLAIAVIFAAAAVSVRLVMKNLLSATPGDLIYDR